LEMAGLDAAAIERQVLRTWAAQAPARPVVAGRAS